MITLASPSQPPSPTPSSDQRNAVAAEYFGKLLERHQFGASESDIRMAFRDFIVQTGIIADESEIKSEVPPGADSANRVDLYARNTYIEFKRNLIIGGDIAPDYIAQLDGYLLDAAKSGWGIQNGILTDGGRVPPGCHDAGSGTRTDAIPGHRPQPGARD